MTEGLDVLYFFLNYLAWYILLCTMTESLDVLYFFLNYLAWWSQSNSDTSTTKGKGSTAIQHRNKPSEWRRGADKGKQRCQGKYACSDIFL